MNKPAYLVEGDLEQKFIQNICPGCPVRKINCNGDDVSLEAIAKRVGTLGRLLHKRYAPLVVVFDREGRPKNSAEIEKAFAEILKSEQIQVRVIVGVPDRDIESWILADYGTFAVSARVPSKADTRCFEGQNGKTAIKQALGQSRTYVETIDGVAWLKANRAEVMRQNSPSFERFAMALAGLSCRWLQQQQLPLDASSGHTK